MILDNGINQAFKGKGFWAVKAHKRIMLDAKGTKGYIVDAIATALGDIDKPLGTHLIKINQALWAPENHNTLPLPVQMFWFGVVPNPKVIYFDDTQSAFVERFHYSYET